MDYIRINNRSNFLISKVPDYHPQSIKYVKYWKRHKKRCIEGYWSKDDADIDINVDEDFPSDQSEGNYRFIPGNLYFYVNFGVILHRPDDAPKSSPKKKIRPHLRDVDWELFYNWIEAKGFSGFDSDDKYSCNRDLDNEKFKGKYDKSCYCKNGELKEYMPARIYLRQLHDSPLGVPMFHNMAQDLFWLACRGVGKSFSVAVGIVLHEFLFDGAQVYNEESIKNPAKVEIFVGAALSSKSSDLLKKTLSAMKALPGEWGAGTASRVPSPLYKQTAGSLGPNNIKNPFRHEYEKKIGGSWETLGSESNIRHGIYTTENPEAAAGGRYSVAVVEEWGLLGNSLNVHGSNTATLMDYPWNFGASIWIGTGGNVEKIQEGEIMFRNPRGFEALSFDDTWEGSGKIGWFTPAYYGMNDYKDENGNTMMDEAMEVINERRAEKSKSKDASALALEMMNYPIKPSEMFLNAHGAMFPQVELKAHKGEVVTNPHRYDKAHYYGELVFDAKGEITWLQSSNSNQVVREWPIKNNKDKPGLIEIREMPKRNGNGEVVRGRYIQGTDTYDDDESVTTSMGSTFVFDLWTSRIVAEYTGRRGAKEFYEITRKLNIFYRTNHNYEKNKKGLYTYYDIKKSTHLLCDTPESLKDVADITISKVGNQAKGTTASKQINAYGLRLILDWLLEPAYGHEEGSEVLNLHTIWGVGLLDELITFNPDVGNYDRVSALIMVMILREEMTKYVADKQKDRVKDLSDDDFFDRNFNAGLVAQNLGVSQKDKHIFTFGQ